MAKQPINLRLDADLVAAADALATATGTDRTELIARGLRRELLYEGGREFVYVLLDEAGEVRYVGRSRDPFARLREHIAGARAGGASAREAWITQLLADGHKPRLAIIDDAEPGAAVASLEADWIEHFRAGGRLTNGTRAGVASGERIAGGRIQIAVRVDDELHAAIESARGEVPRERWMRGVLLAAATGAHGLPSTRGTGSPAPSRAEFAGVPVVTDERMPRGAAKLVAPPIRDAPRQHLATCRCPVCKPAKGGKR